MIHRFLNMAVMIIVLLPALLLPGVPRAADEEPGAGRNDTLLMFVGEDLEVLSIASKRQQSAWQAPAVANVITHEEMAEEGIH